MGESNILNKLPVSASIYIQKIFSTLSITYLIKRKGLLK